MITLEDIKDYKIGYMTCNKEKIAELYEIPASKKMTNKYRIHHTLTEKAVWKLRYNNEGMSIHYVSNADSYKHPVLKKAVDDVYEDAVKDIEAFLESLKVA